MNIIYLVFIFFFSVLFDCFR